MQIEKLRYFDLARHWTRRVEPHLGDKKLNDLLRHDFGLYTERWMGRVFKRGQFPRDFELFEKNNPLPPKKREPRFWRYVKWSSCHYVANFNLRLALLVEKRPWRIITNTWHTTVWDGENTIFEFNYLALELSPAEIFSRVGENIYTLPVGKLGICTKGFGVSVYHGQDKSWRTMNMEAAA